MAWPDAETLMGLIMMLAVGPAAGSYTTSIIYRLPRGQSPFQKHPYCGDCGTSLRPADLFPIWSYVFSGGKCRYCGVRIRPGYCIVEVAALILFVVNFLVFGISERFLLISALGIFLITLAALEYHEDRLFTSVLSYVFFAAILQRALQDGTLYPAVQDGFLLFFISLIVWKLLPNRLKPPQRDGELIPAFCLFAALLGLALPFTQAWLAVALAALCYALQRLLIRWRMLSASAGLGLWLALVWVG